VELSPVGLLVKNEDLKNVRGPVPFPDFGGFLPDDGCDCLIAHLELLSIVYVRAVSVLAQAVPQSAHHMPREIQAGQKIGAGMLRRTQAFALGSMKDDPGSVFTVVPILRLWFIVIVHLHSRAAYRAALETHERLYVYAKLVPLPPCAQ